MASYQLQKILNIWYSTKEICSIIGYGKTKTKNGMTIVFNVFFNIDKSSEE